MTLTASSRDLRLRRVDATLRASGAELVTFDVFDTLVFRRVDRPVDAFALIGRALRESGALGGAMTPAMFGAVREAAEKRAREQRQALDGGVEIDLHDIYDAFPRWPLDQAVTVDDLVATEVEVERGLLVPDLEVVAFLEAIKAEGTRIAGVSDIYFRAETLRDLLQVPRVGTLLEGVELFVSCEMGFGKGSGLWDRAAEVFGVAPERIVHFGDNPVDDVDKALAAGVRACGFQQRDAPLADIKAAERRLRETVARPRPLEWRNTTDPAGLYAMRGKAIAQAEQPRSRLHYWRYGATVLGPVLSGFAQWVAREAAWAGMTRVGCLMREGTLLSELIASAGAVEGIELQAVPTWLNRHVGLAATLGDSSDPVARLLHGRSGLTVCEGLGLLGIEVEDVPALAGQASTSLQDPTVLTMFVQAVDGQPALRAKAGAHGRELAGRAAKVLEAAADPTGRLWLVDVGWGGSIQADAAQLLAATGRDLHVTGFYLLTNASALTRVAAGLDLRSFLLDGGSDSDLVDLVMRSPEIIEQVACADIGTQLGIDAQLRPVTAPLDPATDEQRRDAEAVREGVKSFHDMWLRYRAIVPGALPSLADAQDELVSVLVRSIIAPTSEEARLFGDWLHDEGRGSSREDPLAGVEHERLASHASGDQLQALPMQDLYWPAGLVARYAPEHAPLVQAAATGLVPWEALSAEAGVASFRVTDAVEPDGRPAEVVAIRANPRGNVLLSWSCGGADLRELTVQLCRDTHVVRIDSLELRLWEQGSGSPRVVRLAGDDVVLAVPRDSYVSIGHNVLVGRASGASLSVDLLHLRQQVVYRLQVVARFGLLEVPAPLGGHIPLESAQIDQLKQSVSWRVTSPLRRVAGAGRRLR